MKWDKILKVIQIPKVNLDAKDRPPEYEEEATCRKKLIAMLYWGLNNYDKYNQYQFLNINYDGEKDKNLTSEYIENLIMSFSEENVCNMLKTIETTRKNKSVIKDFTDKGKEFTYFFGFFERVYPNKQTPSTNISYFWIWDDTHHVILNIDIEMLDYKIVTEKKYGKLTDLQMNDFSWINADSEDAYQDFSNTLFRRNEGYDSQVLDFKKEDILKVIQIPKVNLDTEDKPPEYENPDDKCRKEIIAFSDAMKKIGYPFSDIKNSNQGVAFGPHDNTKWKHIVWQEDIIDTDFGFNGDYFQQDMEYELFIHNGRIKDGMRSSNLPEEVACRILELFDENMDKINFNINEEVAGFKIEYYAAGGDKRFNEKELYFNERDEEGLHKVVPEVYTTFINHSLEVYNSKGLDVLTIETALTLKNVLTAMPPATGSELQYNRDARESFMWFPNVVRTAIFHYVNIGKLYDWYQKGAYRF